MKSKELSGLVVFLIFFNRPLEAESYPASVDVNLQRPIEMVRPSVSTDEFCIKKTQIWDEAQRELCQTMNISVVPFMMQWQAQISSEPANCIVKFIKYIWPGHIVLLSRISSVTHMRNVLFAKRTWSSWPHPREMAPRQAQVIRCVGDKQTCIVPIPYHWASMLHAWFKMDLTTDRLHF